MDTAGILHPNHKPLSLTYSLPSLISHLVKRGGYCWYSSSKPLSLTYSLPSLIWWGEVDTAGILHPNLSPLLTHSPPSSGGERWILLVFFIQTSLPYLLTPLPHLVGRGGYCWYSSSKPYFIPLSLSYSLPSLISHLVRRGGYCWYSSSKPY